MMSTRQLQCIRKLPFKPQILKAITNKGLQRLTKQGHQYDIQRYFQCSYCRFDQECIFDIYSSYCTRRKQFAEEKTQPSLKIITYILRQNSEERGIVHIYTILDI
jgi:hypothetical protein